jgi:hypothetical protein
MGALSVPPCISPILRLYLACISPILPLSIPCAPVRTSAAPRRFHPSSCLTLTALVCPLFIQNRPFYFLLSDFSLPPSCCPTEEEAIGRKAELDIEAATANRELGRQLPERHPSPLQGARQRSRRQGILENHPRQRRPNHPHAHTPAAAAAAQ